MDVIAAFTWPLFWLAIATGSFAAGHFFTLFTSGFFSVMNWADWVCGVMALVFFCSIFAFVVTTIWVLLKL